MTPAKVAVLIAKDFVMPLVSVFLGAWLAFLFERRARKEEREERYRTHLKLLQGDFEKAKRFLGQTLKEIKDLPPNQVPTAIYQLPTSYFSTIDFVGLGNYISAETIEHIRNLTEYMFPRWNENMPETIRSLRMDAQQKRKVMIDLANQELSSCDVTIQAIAKELKTKGLVTGDNGKRKGICSKSRT